MNCTSGVTYWRANHDRELFSHLFWKCDVLQLLINWIEDLMGGILHHQYSVTAKAMVFCDIVPTGFTECDKLVLSLTCLAQHVILTERNCVKYEAKTVSSEGFINLAKAQMRIRVYADF